MKIYPQYDCIGSYGGTRCNQLRLKDRAAMLRNEILSMLNAKTAEERLGNLKIVLAEEREKPKVLPQYANNHIHTIYSFSPYSPTAAVWAAREAGLLTAGIMDHDSIAGGEEFRAAAEIAGIGVTCGFEMRVSLAGTPFENKKTNNPDQNGIAYMAFHSVRREYFQKAEERLAPLRRLRNERNRKMLIRISEKTGISLDLEKDVIPLSMYSEGGAVTERHILFALADRMLENGGYMEKYDLLGKLKAEMMKDIYVPARDELISLDDADKLSNEIGAILCYPYLGDVTDSPTGDKSAAKFEDGYLEELIAFLMERGVHFVTFAPSRNTMAQLDKLMSLCREFGMGQISGEDINSPRQSFICPQLSNPKFEHLVDAAWMLVNREKDGA